MDLINMITGQLGINEEQAQGGAGLIFNMIKDKASSEEFSSITNAIPEITEYQEAAPKMNGVLNAIGSLTSSFNGNSSLGNLAEVAGGFSKLNLDTGMIGKFIPIILEFVKGKGGENILGIVSKFIK